MPEESDRVVFLLGKRLYLRPIEESDLGRCQRWMNDPQIGEFMLNPYPVDMAGQRGWHERRDRGRPRTDMIFAIVLIDGDRHIGNIGLHNIDWINRSATTGALIGEKECWSQGYGGEAKELVLEYAFMRLGLHRIGSGVFATNPRSFAYLKKSGYVEEGRERERIFRDGRWVDLINLGILASDWRQSRGR